MLAMQKLSIEERQSLVSQHRYERDKRICDRIKAVLLRDEGWTYEQIAHVLLLTKEAIRQHVDDYEKLHKLRPVNGGSEEKLSAEQSQSLETHLQTHTYLYVKDIIAYIQSAWSITYKIAGLTNWLHRHGFSYKKPALVPGKADREQQQKWLEEYQKLKQGLPADETICFMDGVHPTHNVQPAYGWIKKGMRKEIPANSGRSRINLSGIIDIVDHKVLVQEDQMLNASATICFFEKIERAYPEKSKVHLFCDNAKYYRNKAVTEYLKSSRIQLHFLPPYSPNLNPIERLWKWMKERVVYNTYYQDFADFKLAIFGFFSTLSKLTTDSILGQDFRSRIRDKFRLVGT